MKKLLLILSLGIVISSCTNNEKVKSWGGTAKFNLPVNKKLVNITWKGDEIWYLVKDMKITDSAETYEFKEKSSYGMMEGTYIIHEVKE